MTAGLQQFRAGMRAGVEVCQKSGAGRRSLLLVLTAAAFLLSAGPRFGAPAPTKTESGVRLKNLATIGGVRSNQLVGYGIVVGLPGTGDSRSRLASQSIRNLLGRLGQKLPADPDARNIAAVLVTAQLPPFSGRGHLLDVTVSSIGDAQSLTGGVLITTALQAGDGKIYAVGQGVVTTGGRSNVGRSQSRKTVGVVLGGATVEKAPGEQFAKDSTLHIRLKTFDFATLSEVHRAVAKAFPKSQAKLAEGSVEVRVPDGEDPFTFTAALEELRIEPKYGARVIINERSGTVVMGGDIRVDPVSISRAGLSVIVTAGSRDKAGISDELRIDYGPGKEAQSREVSREFSGTSVAEIVKGLNAMGADVRDIIAILEALKDSGALHAKLTVI